MALQHFYTRVPARVSMYNKTDSYDTFACSEGVSRAFAEKQLSVVCDLKLSTIEIDSIRKTGLPPVYCQFLTAEGSMVQSCISFQPADYTGERCTYLVHSLVLSEEEKKSLFENCNNAILNPAAFVTDMSGFNVTATDSRPNKNYPVLNFVPQKYVLPENRANYVADLNRDTLKRFLFGLLTVLCNKGKSLYVVLNTKERESCDFFENLVNSVGSVLPVQYREQLSYVSRIVNVPAQFPSFKLKGIYFEDIAVPQMKGIVVNFATDTVSGVRDEDVVANIQMVDFLVSLLKDDYKRVDFHRFWEYAAERRKQIAVPNLKTLGEMIFLFKCGCGAYEEKNILPNDDRILDLMTVYETYRNALPDEFRIRIFRTLNRYAAAKVEIPKKTFAKIQKIYPSEIPATKHIFMQIALELIHFDFMRDKLFTFVKTAYPSEEEESKAEIIHHISQVFYGGFLQTQIFAFLALNYRTAPAQSKREMLDKVLLLIRTKALRQEIISFIDRLYDDFDADSREAVYAAVLEQLEEGDDLAVELMSYIDRHIYEESREFRDSVSERLISIAAGSFKSADSEMLRLFVRTDGFCSKTIAMKMITDWVGKKFFPKYITQLCNGTLKTRYDNLIALYKLMPEDSDTTVTHIINAAVAAFNESPCNASCREAYDEALRLVAEENPFCEKLLDAIAYELVGSGVYDTFRGKGNPPSPRELLAFGAEHSRVSDCKQFAYVVAYAELEKATASGDLTKIITVLDALPKDKKVKADFAQYLRTNLLPKAASTGTLATLRLMTDWFADGGIALDTQYDEVFAFAEQAAAASGSQGKDKRQNAKPDKAVAFSAADALFGFCLNTEQMPELSDELKNAAKGENSGAKNLITTLIGNHGRFSVQYLESKFGSDKESAFSVYCLEATHELAPSGGFSDFLRKLFGKKDGKNGKAAKAPKAPKPPKAPKAPKPEKAPKVGKISKADNTPKVVDAGNAAKADNTPKIVEADNTASAAPIVETDNAASAAPIVEADNTASAASIVETDNTASAAPIVEADNADKTAE